MKTHVISICLCAALLLSLAACGSPKPESEKQPAETPAEEPSVPDAPTEPKPADQDAELSTAADTVLAAMSAGDFAALSACADADGVTFSPYSYVDFDRNLTFSPEQLAAFGTDETLYTWGSFDGSGDPIEKTCMDYWTRFVWNQDYSKAPTKTVNGIAGRGSSIENVDEAYPHSDTPTEGGFSYIEYYYPGFDEQFEGMDWCSLKLVFVLRDGAWRLRGIIHSEWTV